MAISSASCLKAFMKGELVAEFINLRGEAVGDFLRGGGVDFVVLADLGLQIDEVRTVVEFLEREFFLPLDCVEIVLKLFLGADGVLELLLGVAHPLGLGGGVLFQEEYGTLYPGTGRDESSLRQGD